MRIIKNLGAPFAAFAIWQMLSISSALAQAAPPPSQDNGKSLDIPVTLVIGVILVIVAGIMQFVQIADARNDTRGNPKAWRTGTLAFLFAFLGGIFIWASGGLSDIRLFWTN